MRQRDRQSGFGRVEIVLIVFVIAALGVTGLVLYQRQTPSRAKNIAATSPSQTTTQPQSTVTQSATSQGWNTYNDTGYAAASGISIKYPPGWQINVNRVKKVGNTNNPTAIINERVVFLPSSEAPKDEWNTCATNISADACGAAPGDKTLSSNESTINGLAAYTATMQNSYGTYHVTVIRGNKSTPPAGTPYVEFTTTTSDPAALNSYAASMASATFPN
jgi:hypothetical protein